MKTTLVVLAAGMGSRYGGLKQIEPVGPAGQAILDYSVYDALEAGFDKVVCIIKKAIDEDFRAIVGTRLEKMGEVEYAYQELDMLPDFYTPDPNRTKPYGTGHALLCALPLIDGPCCIVNADDYYGKKGFKLIYDHLTTENTPCMAGFMLHNTLTENGTVARGVCEVENGYLKKVTEHTAIAKDNDFPKDTVVSMNMWGFDRKSLDMLKDGFENFLKSDHDKLKGEYYIPYFVNTLIEAGKAPKVFLTDDKWYGVTYREDTESVKAALKEMTEKGWYK